MSSYLSKLAARAVEQPQPIRPRLASLFEPVAGPKVHWTEVTANRRARKPRSVKPHQHDRNEAPPLDATPTRSAVDRGAEVVPVVHQTPSAPREDHPPDKWVSDSVTQPTTPAPILDSDNINGRSLDERSVTVEAATAFSEEPQSTGPITPGQQIRDETEPRIQIVPSIPVEEITVIETRIQSAPQSILSPETTDDATEAPRGATVIVKPRVTADHAPAPSLDAPLPAPEAPSSIRITIGRVEVRAIMPQSPPAAVARQTAAGGALSLDEYLKKRNGA